MKTAKHVAIIIVCAAVACAALASASSVPTKGKITGDRILVEKAVRRLTLLRDGKAIKTYRIALGKNAVGNKVKQGDGKTPEGVYKIDWRNRNSSYHRALHISYPTPNDVERARRNGVSPGGNILIHGLPNGYGWIGSLHTKTDWTLGCIAVTDEEIEEIWEAVPDGTPVEIRP